MAKRMTRPGAVKLADRLKNIGFTLDYDGRRDSVPMSATYKEGERKIGEWITLTKVTFFSMTAQRYWVVVEISVYRYNGSKNCSHSSKSHYYFQGICEHYELLWDDYGSKMPQDAKKWMKDNYPSLIGVNDIHSYNF